MRPAPPDKEYNSVEFPNHWRSQGAITRVAWKVFAMLGVGAGTAHFIVPSTEARGWIYLALGLSGVASVVAGVRINRPEYPAAWYVFAAGLLVFFLGDGVFYYYKLIRDVERPFPSVADGFFLASYPLLSAGLLLMIRRRNPGGDKDSLIDACIIAAGMGLLAHVYLIAPAIEPGMPWLERAISVAYPLGDVALLAVAARLAMTAGSRRPAYWFLGVAVVSLLAADIAYAVSQLTGNFEVGTALDAGWMGFYLFSGVAALHPSMATLAHRARGERRSGRLRLAVLGGVVLIAPAVLAVQVVREEYAELEFVAAASVVLSVLVLARMGNLLRSLSATAARERTLRDAAAAFGASTDRNGLYAAASSAARQLVGEHGEGTYLAMWSAADVVADAFRDTAEPGADSVQALDGDRRANGDRPPDAPLGLAELDAVLNRGGAGSPAGTVVTPILVQEELQGALVVVSEPPLPPELCRSLDTLTTQLSMALERTALSDDLHQRRGEARFRSLVHNSTDVITVVDADTTVRFQTPSVRQVLGYDPEALVGTRLIELVHRDCVSSALGLFDEASAAAGPNHPVELRVRRADGSWVDVEALGDNLLGDPNVAGIVVTLRDISDRKAFERKLQHQALHDSLTGLANRALFTDRVEHALARRRPEGHSVVVVFLDLDDFKTVNDSLGHAAGDQLLSSVAERLSGCLRPSDTTARLGGDEFAVLLEEVESPEAAFAAADRLRASLVDPFALEGKEVDIHASLGIAFADDGAVGPEELLRNADIAMYMAKSRHKGGYEVFEPSMHEAALRRLDLKAELQRAVDNGDFVLQYQPIVGLDTDRVVGFEALVRWVHAERGMVPPGEFVALAEETNLILPLGRWVLEQAARQGRSWHAQLGTTMSINLSQKQLAQAGLVDEVADVLRRTGVDPAAVTLEITESVVMHDVERTVDVLQRLRDLGVSVAIDDFGTGYSSLATLRQLPIDVLKIDKAFVDGVAESAEDAVLVGTVIDLARGLGLTTVAEGIETSGQLAKLRQLGCQRGQGYHFARPLHGDDAEDLARRHGPHGMEGGIGSV